MIVKNETANLPRCLGSLAPWISCWAITDTGSKDATIAMAGNLLRERPGVLSQAPFVDFAQARNAAYEVAKASNLDYDYVILCDADWELVVTDPHCFDNLTEPTYSIKTIDPPGSVSYALTRLIRRDIPCQFVGVTHEYPDTAPHYPKLLDGCHFIEYPTGASRPTKFERDIALLTKGLKDEPDNGRYMFYLGESNYHLNRLDEANKWFQRRFQMGGWQFEQWYCGYRIAQILRIKGLEADWVNQVLNLYEKFPDRAEPLYPLARHYQQTGRHRLGYEIARLAMNIPRPSGDACFVESEVYDWGLKDVAAICGFYVGRKDEARALNEAILPIVPKHERARIAANLAFCVPEKAPANPAKILDLSRCLVIATIGDREPDILSIMNGARTFHLKIIDYGKRDRGIGAMQWPADGRLQGQRIKLLFDNRTIAIDDYDYFWFPCDDIGDLAASDVERLFALAHQHDLQLCQPSLSPSSAAIGWGITLNVPGSVVRRTNFVESMAPLFSAAAWKICMPTIDENLSGYGLDLIWPKLLGNKGIAIIDAVVARHTRPHSSYHQPLENGKTAWQELHETLAAHGLDFYAVRDKVRNLPSAPALLT